jgi:GAF domain/Type II secretion system (T2SS), protein E, N-terminal domain
MKKTPDSGEVVDPLQFFRKLQALMDKIHVTSQIEEVMLDLSHEICDVFLCDRLTLYVLGRSKTHIESKVKTGLRSYKDFSLPISEESVAGFVALTKQSVNIGNVYDENELQTISPGLKFMQAVDVRTGYRTRQLLVSPLLNQENGELLGVVQLINNRSDNRFSSMMEDGLQDLCEAVSQVFSKRLASRLVTPGKYDSLVMNGLLSSQELEMAQLLARLKQVDLQTILIEDMRIRPASIGLALAHFFGVPYAPFLADRKVPEAALAQRQWASAEHKRWLLLEQTSAGLVILTTDPDRVRGARLVNQLFPGQTLYFQVTTQAEFRQTAAQFFGSDTGQDESEPHASLSGANEEHWIEQIRQAIASGLAGAVPGIKMELKHEPGQLMRRLRPDGSVHSLRGKICIDYSLDLPENPVNGPGMPLS